MINLNNFKLVALMVCFFLNGCKGMKETFEEKKKNNSDEFLVEKKSPLVLPPEFSDLPTPENSVKKDTSEKSFDLQKSILNPTKNSKKIQNKKLLSIEKSILDRIK